MVDIFDSTVDYDIHINRHGSENSASILGRTHSYNYTGVCLNIGRVQYCRINDKPWFTACRISSLLGFDSVVFSVL